MFEERMAELIRLIKNPKKWSRTRKQAEAARDKKADAGEPVIPFSPVEYLRFIRGDCD